MDIHRRGLLARCQLFKTPASGGKPGFRLYGEAIRKLRKVLSECAIYAGAFYAVVTNASIRLLYCMNGKKKSKEGRTLLDEQQHIQKKIGERFRELRQATGLSQEKFANTHGLDRRQITRIEAGANVEINTLVALTRALNVSIADFFKDFTD
jgi:DNA-binding XRE family transcriptional regulator